MKVLTAAEMREVDRRTVELGIPSLILMENAGQRVMELLAEMFAPLKNQRIVVICGKGNNGGDGLVVARQLHTRVRPRSLAVVLATAPAELSGDAAANFRMLEAAGCPVQRDITAELRDATLVIDALLGTGLNGPPRDRALELIRAMNHCFPAARVVAVDVPSGINSDSAGEYSECARADYTVTFTAPKICHALPPNCDRVGRVRVGAIGSPPALYEVDEFRLNLVEPAQFAHLLAPRPRSGHKGDFGHVLVLAGSRGKTGAAALAGLGALRSGAGLVTVASAASAIGAIAANAAELMTEPLPETGDGAIAADTARALAGKDVLAIGPGLGTHPDTVALVRRLVAQDPRPMVLDADALNALAGSEFDGGQRLRVLTPHPGEMARLSGITVEEILPQRVELARSFAADHRVTLVLKGQRTLVAFPSGQVWINPTGTPAMAKGGSGDVLTGLLAGLLAQFPHEPENAVLAAVYLHGLAGERGAAAMGEQALVASDLLRYFPEAIRALPALPHQV